MRIWALSDYLIVISVYGSYGELVALLPPHPRKVFVVLTLYFPAEFMDLQSNPQIGYDWNSIEEECGSGDDSDVHDSEDED